MSDTSSPVDSGSSSPALSPLPSSASAASSLASLLMSLTHQTPTMTPPPSSTSILSTTSYMTLILTQPNGSTITTTSALPTSLSTETSSPTQSDSSRVGIIAGATVAVISLLLVSLALVFFYQRKRLQKIWDDIPTRGHRGGGRRERKGLLEDDDLDDHLRGVGIRNDGGRNLATASGDADKRQSQMNPTSWGFRSTRSLDLQPSLSSFYSSQRSTSSTSLSHPAQDSSIHSFSTSSFYHVRPPGSGSVFREEGIWPPPGEVTDPFARHVKSEEMGDVGKRGLEMGNAATRLSSSAFEDSPLRSFSSQTTADLTDSVIDRDAAMANRGHQIVAAGSATSVIGDVGNDPAVDLSSLPPLFAAPGIVKVGQTPQELNSKSTPLKSILKMGSSSSSGGGSSGDRTDLDDSGARKRSLDVIPSHHTRTIASTTVASAIATAHRFAPSLSPFQLHNRSSTVGTTKSYTSESIYSTETADAAVESGYVSFGSTPPPPPPPPPGLSFTPLPFHHRPSVLLPPARTLKSTLNGSPFVGVTTATKSSTTVRGIPIFSYDKQSTSSSFYSQVSAATTTTTNTGVSGGSLYSQESAAAHAAPVGISNRDMKVGLRAVDEFGGKTI